MAEQIFRLISVPWLALLLLHVVRAGAFLVAMNFTGSQAESKILRIILATALGAILFAVTPDHGSNIPEVQQRLHGGLFGLCIMVVQEAIIGIAAGFALNLLMTILTGAGELMSIDMGFAMARSLNPVTGTNSTVMSQLMQTFGFLLIFALNLHHEAIRLLAMSSELVPVGVTPDIGAIFDGLRNLASTAIEWAARLAFPIIAVMLLLTSTLVMLSRAVQNINLMEVAFGVRILLALSAGTWFLADGLQDFPRLFHMFLEGAAGMLRPA